MAAGFCWKWSDPNPDGTLVAPNFGVLVRNVYKVLLTRGLIGCVLYSTDPETRALLTKLGIPAA